MLVLIMANTGCSIMGNNSKSSIDKLGANYKKELTSEYLATIKNPVKSPSGKYLLIIIEGNDGIVNYNQFQIAKINNEEMKSEVIFNSLDKFRTRDTVYFLWDNEDRVWVYSGDIGTFYWIRKNDNVWEKQRYVDHKDTPVPEILKKLRPNVFK